MSSTSSNIVDVHVDRQTEIEMAPPSPPPPRPRPELLFVEGEDDIVGIPGGIPPRPRQPDRFPAWPWTPGRYPARQRTPGSSPGSQYVWPWTPGRFPARPRASGSSPSTQYWTPASSRPPGTPPPGTPPPVRFQPPPAPAPYLNRFKIVGIILVLIIVAAACSGWFLIRRGDKKHDTAGIDCPIKIFVAQDGTGNFSSVSEAVQASPDESPVRICIYVRAGTYVETVILLIEKTNLALIGEGAEKTIISSDHPAQPTLANDGNNLLVRDLKIVNSADEGTAVDNWGRHTVFYRCEVHGRNATLHVQAYDQFYRECKFYGQNHIVSGYGRAFFQKSSFFGENSDAKLTMSSFWTISPPSSYTSSTSLFIFHRCHFVVVLQSTWVLSGSMSAVSVVLLQSDLDAALGGYYLPDLPPQNDTFYAIYKNTAHGDAMKIAPPFVHRLGDVLAADQFSLASFFNNKANWIPQGVAYDLAL